MYRVSPHLPHFARALVAGAILASLWVNISPDSYYDAVEYRLWAPDLPGWTGLSAPVLTLQTITSEGLMALFIAFIAKELWEALALERGALSGATRRIMPLGAVVGGVIGAVLVWLLVAPNAPELEEATRASGWPVPIGSDVVLCYVFGARAFGRGHPALHLLLLISIAFDILGLIALPFGFATSGLHPLWLLPSVIAVAWVALVTARRTRPGASEVQHRRAAHLWSYVLAAVVTWAGIVAAGLPGALGLLPLIPAIPHAARSFGLFAEAEEYLHDPLNRLAHLLARPLTVILFLFGLTRGGVDLGALGEMTLKVLAALWIGKPLGLMAGAALALWRGGLSLPRGIRLSDLVLIAVLTGIGVTVPLLALDSTLPGGIPADQARAGAALSLLFGPLALLLARMFSSHRDTEAS